MTKLLKDSNVISLLGEIDIDRSHCTGFQNKKGICAIHLVVKFKNYNIHSHSEWRLKLTVIWIRGDLTSSNLQLFKEVSNHPKISSGWMDIRSSGNETSKKCIRFSQSEQFIV